MNRNTLLVLALVALLVVATTWLSEKSEQPKPVTPAEAEGVVDYFIRGFDGTETASNGTPSQLLKAASLRHYAATGVTELEQPDLTIYRKPGEQWLVRAHQGRMTDEGNELQLSGQVILTQRSKQQPLTLSTDNLILYPQRHFAETKSAVTITAPTGKIQGVGMKVYGDEQRLLLLSTIRGTYYATAP